MRMEIGVVAGVASYAVSTDPADYNVGGFVTAGAIGGVSGALGGGLGNVVGGAAYSNTAAWSVFRVSSKSIPFGMSKSGYGHISLFVGQKIR